MSKTGEKRNFLINGVKSNKELKLDPNDPLLREKAEDVKKGWARVASLKYPNPEIFD